MDSAQDAQTICLGSTRHPEVSSGCLCQQDYLVTDISPVTVLHPSRIHSFLSAPRGASEERYAAMPARRGAGLMKVERLKLRKPGRLWVHDACSDDRPLLSSGNLFRRSF